jgi:hypothetical protein
MPPKKNSPVQCPVSSDSACVVHTVCIQYCTRGWQVADNLGARGGDGTPEQQKGGAHVVVKLAKKPR